METVYRYVDGVGLGSLRNALFQKRIEVDIYGFDWGDVTGVNFVFQPADHETREVTCACCTEMGEVLQGTPGFGEIRIPRHAYDAYPFNKGDPTVVDALATIEDLCRNVVAVLGNG